MQIGDSPSKLISLEEHRIYLNKLCSETAVEDEAVPSNSPSHQQQPKENTSVFPEPETNVIAVNNVEKEPNSEGPAQNSDPSLAEGAVDEAALAVEALNAAEPTVPNTDLASTRPEIEVLGPIAESGTIERVASSIDTSSSEPLSASSSTAAEHEAHKESSMPTRGDEVEPRLNLADLSQQKGKEEEQQEQQPRVDEAALESTVAECVVTSISVTPAKSVVSRKDPVTPASSKLDDDQCFAR